MICKKCGKHIDDDARFCPECGTAQFGGVPAYSEHELRRKRNISIALWASLGGIVVGVAVKRIDLVVPGAAVFTVAAIKLNNLRKRDR